MQSQNIKIPADVPGIVEVQNFTELLLLVGLQFIFNHSDFLTHK